MSLPPLSVDVTMDVPAGAIVESWRFYIREQGTEGWLPIGASDSPHARLEGLPRTGLWEVAAAPLVAGIEGDTEAWTVVPWKPDADDFETVENVVGFRAEQSGNLILLAWPPVEQVALDHYEIRLGATWDDAVLVDKVPPYVTSYTTGARYTGANTYWIAAVTRHGTHSSSPTAATSVDVEAQSYEPVQGTSNESGGGFTGTKTSVEVSGGDLRLTAVPANIAAATMQIQNASWPVGLPHYGEGNYVTAWTDVGSVVRERVEVSLVLAASAASIPVSQVSLLVGDCGNVLPSLYDARGLQYEVWVDTAQDGVPTPDGYRRWIPGAVYKYRQVRLKLALVSIVPRNLVVDTFIWRRRRLNRKDEQIATVTGTGGTAVTWATPFTAAPTVAVSVDTALSRHATVESITTSGCSVRVWDAAGTEQASGTVNVLAMGV